MHVAPCIKHDEPIEEWVKRTREPFDKLAYDVLRAPHRADLPHNTCPYVRKMHGKQSAVEADAAPEWHALGVRHVWLPCVISTGKC